MPKREVAVSQKDTIKALLARTNRRKNQLKVPIRRTFLQQGNGHPRDPGPVAAICRNHDERGLDLYLLILAIASSSDPYSVKFPAPAWARTIGMDGDSSNALSAVSKALRRLKDHQLITTDRVGRESRITLLNEDGHGDPYIRPATADDRYFKLPYEYWTQRWHLKLSLRAKVALLIALSLKDGFQLPAERGPDWYGISADTLQRGLTELVEKDLLEFDDHVRVEPLSAIGTTVEREYSLLPPFGVDPLKKAARLATVTSLRKQRTG
jgi:DNA-binding transcriptional ArsR family regulator